MTADMGHQVDEEPLDVIFDRARGIAENASNSGKEREDTMRDLETCRALVAQLGLFSSNEEVDDITTTNLKYLLVHAYLASLLSQTDCREPAPRAALLGQAMEHYNRFVSLCSDYGLVSKELAATAVAAEAGAKPLDPAAQRAGKIARFKREREVKAALQAMQQQRVGRMRLAQLHADGEGEDGVVGIAEDDERELWLLMIESQLLQAVEQMTFLKTELELLQHAATLPEEDRRQAGGVGRPQGTQEASGEVMRVLAAAAANLEKRTGSSLVSGRQQTREDVLRPTHNLPTITLAQQAEYEMEQARKVAASTAAAAAASGEQSDQDDDAAIQKARAWDDFKDDNPRGWGNKKGRG